MLDENNLTKNIKKLIYVHKILSRVRRVVLISSLLVSLTGFPRKVSLFKSCECVSISMSIPLQISREIMCLNEKKLFFRLFVTTTS